MNYPDSYGNHQPDSTWHTASTAAVTGTASNLIWTTGTTATVSPVYTVRGPAHVNHSVLEVPDIRIQGLGSMKELLQNLTFLTPPTGLDTDNPAVQDGLKSWYQAVQELRHRHEQLQMLIKLTHEPS